MAEKVIMPKQGLQMTEGTITRWMVQEGGECVSGQPLFEMETDKLVITIDANVSGTLLKILAAEGATVPITETIAIIGTPGEDIAALLPQAEKQKQEEPEKVMQPSQTAVAAPAAPGAAQTQEGPVYATPRAKWRRRPRWRTRCRFRPSSAGRRTCWSRRARAARR